MTEKNETVEYLAGETEKYLVAEASAEYAVSKHQGEYTFAGMILVVEVLSPSTSKKAGRGLLGMCEAEEKAI